MTLKIRLLFAGLVGCCFSTHAVAGPVSTYLRKSPNERAEAEHVPFEARFEAWLREPSLMSFDRDGTVRNAAGRPVGWWGIEGRHAPKFRR